jgi:hypothetical protein
MAESALRPVSIDRVINLLVHEIDNGPTKTFRTLHAEALDTMKALERDLAETDAAARTLETAYAELDAIHARDRARHIEMFGSDSAQLPIKDRLYAISVDRRLAAREVAAAMAAQLDIMLKNFLEGGVTVAELKSAAELGIGALPGTAPLTIALEGWKSLDKSIDRLGQMRDAGEQYALKVEIFSTVVASFSALFRALRQNIDRELGDL